MSDAPITYWFLESPANSESTISTGCAVSIIPGLPQFVLLHKYGECLIPVGAVPMIEVERFLRRASKDKIDDDRYRRLREIKPTPDAKVRALLTALDLPDLAIDIMDYGQEVIVALNKCNPCFLRYGKNYAAIADVKEIKEWLQTQRTPESPISWKDALRFIRGSVNV